MAYSANYSDPTKVLFLIEDSTINQTTSLDLPVEIRQVTVPLLLKAHTF